MTTQQPLRIRMREWSRCPEDPSQFVTGVVLPDDPTTRALLNTLHRQNKLHIMEYRCGIAIETTSFIGKITVGLLDITIEPKLAGLPLMRLLRYAYELRHLDQIVDTDFAVAGQTFQEMLIHELAQEAQALLVRGLRRESVRCEDALASPRGRIDIQQVARTSGLTTAALPCAFHERREDTLLNQALLAGLMLAGRMTADPVLRGRISRIVHGLAASVVPVRLSDQLLARARQTLSRLTASYLPSLTLIALLWENQGLSLEEGPSVARVTLPGFLFDMNAFFQALISRFLSENLPGHRLENESRLRDVFAYDPNFNPRRRRPPAPRPDYVLWQADAVAAILDAKYRDLWATPLPAEWLYQLTIYAISHARLRKATILYPQIGPMAREARILVRDPVLGGGQAHIVVRPVDLVELDQVIVQRETPRARVLANRLAFG